MANLARPARIGLLLMPVLLPLAFIFGGAIFVVLVESFNVYVPGRIIHGTVSLTVENYKTFLSPAYAGFFLTTLRLAAMSTITSLVLAYPIAHMIVRLDLQRLRSIIIGIIILSFFLSAIVRVVSLILVLGQSGLFNSVLISMGISRVTLVGKEIGVLIGLIHFQVPLAVLVLVGPIRNVDRDLEEAAQGLGASQIRTFLEITLPLTMPGVLAAAMLIFADAVSIFVIPLFLGVGIVNMISNLIYDRFADVLNFPEGAALAVILLLTSIVVTYLAAVCISRWGINKWERQIV